VKRTGGQALVAELERQGVDMAFCVPGESYLPVLDALHDSSIRLISCRHEAAAANMAEAYGKVTGRPGICLVTRGPGATHASVGVHTADQDSTPMILLVGQVPRRMLGRNAFQELDYPAVFGSFTAWTGQATSADTLSQLVAQAFASALGERPGPVVVSLPEDVLSEETDEPDAEPIELPEHPPGEAALERLRELLAWAQQPLVIVGEGGWTAAAARDALAFCEQNELPVACSFRCQDYVDNHSRCYAGHLTIGMDPKLGQRVLDADLIVAIGGRLGEITTGGYSLLEPPRPRQTLVHVHPDANELGRVYETDLAIVSGLPAFAAAARALDPVEPTWRAWADEARRDYEVNLRHSPQPGDLDLGEVMAFLRERLPADAVLTCGAGNFTVWAHRFYEFSQYGTQLAPRSGTMGYGLPAALAAKAIHPDRLVVCIAGDGDFMMSAAELATSVQHELPVIVLVVDNGMYGTIRMHQERLFGRGTGTDLVNPDFAEYARSFGCHAESVERTEAVADAFERCVASGRPAVLRLRVDPEGISPRATLSELRREAHRP
jgi:acetolactate synthase I/II/III large subunit